MSGLILIGAGTIILGGAAIMFFRSLPREEDYFALSMVEMLEFTTTHRTSPPDHAGIDDPATGGPSVQSGSVSFIPNDVCAVGETATPVSSNHRGRSHLRIVK